MSIGERIVELRKKQNITQTDLAGILDVSRQAVSKWENDLTAPDTLNLIRLADALDTDVEYLATGNHTIIKSPPQVITEVVEKVIEKPVVLEKIVEVEKTVDHVIEKPVIRKVYRTKYLRNPVEYLLVFLLGLVVGMIAGMII